MRRSSFLTLLVVFSLVRGGLAQNPSPAKTTQPAKPAAATATDSQQDDVVKITTNLVQVDAVVTKDGRMVKGLQKEDFEIFEDGRPQEIVSFSYISNVADKDATIRTSSRDADGVLIPSGPVRPNENRRTVALVVDDMGLTFESLVRVRRQLQKFVETEVAPNDLVAIIRTSGTMGALQQFTTDRRATTQAINQLSYNHCSRVGVTLFDTGPMSIPLCASGSPVTLNAVRFIVEAMGYLPGRKSLILFSDSLPIEEQESNFANVGINSADLVHQGSNSSAADASKLDGSSFNNYSLLQKVAEKAIRSSVVIYTVDAKGLVYTGTTAADNIRATSMRDHIARTNSLMSSRSQLLFQMNSGADLIARQTGGFLVRNSNSMGLDRILEDQSGYYLLGYRPSEETFNKSFHKIKARVKPSGMTVRTRFGFYGVSEEDANRAKPTIDDNMTLALMSPFTAQAMAIDLTAFYTHNKTSGSAIRSFVNLNAKDLTFKESPDGVLTAIVEFRSILFGNNGQIVDKQTVGKTISMRGDGYQKALREGISIPLETHVRRPGSYQFRIAARDIESAKIGTAGQFISIPDLSKGQLAISGIVLQEMTPTGNQVQKRFRAGSNAKFTFVIYNATLDPAKRQPNLVVTAKLFSDDKVVFSSPGSVVDTNGQPDLSHLLASGTVGLKSSLDPGPYALQIVVIDTTGKGKPTVMQWINFEVVK
jgi:VWFA-related protein